jgi:hypothetical protein
VVLICVVRISVSAQMIPVSSNYMNYRVINLSASYDLSIPTALPPRVYVARLEWVTLCYGKTADSKCQLQQG